jgi:hypothetical protein
VRERDRERERERERDTGREIERKRERGTGKIICEVFFFQCKAVQKKFESSKTFVSFQSICMFAKKVPKNL